ncbi:MAG: hypothetical protein AB7I38_11160 [Dehalococcoidia bacterium]
MTLERVVFVAVVVGAPVGWAVLGIGVAMWARELASDVRDLMGIGR